MTDNFYIHNFRELIYKCKEFKKNKFAYDLWGASVNMASRMESTGVKNGIQISETTYELIKKSIKCQKRKNVDVKGIGISNTYLVI